MKNVNPQIYQAHVMDRGLRQFVETSHTEHPNHLRAALKSSIIMQQRTKLNGLLSRYENKQLEKK